MTFQRIAAGFGALLLAAAAAAGSYDDFFTAIVRDNPRTIKSLLDKGFDANTRDEKGQTGLYVAIRNESLNAAEAILNGPKLDVNALNAAGESALMMAALKGQLELATKLLAHGAAVNKEGWAPLHYAATGPNDAVIGLLIDRGADIDARSPNGSTPLMLAAGYGPESNVDLLLKRGADVKRLNDLKLGAVDFARRAGRDSLAERLAAAAR
jgi:ankyrin repeat protein